MFKGWRKIKEMNSTLQLAIQGAYPDVVFDHWHPSKHHSVPFSELKCLIIPARQAQVEVLDVTEEYTPVL